jgi:AcrR family transcriptional regulator
MREDTRSRIQEIALELFTEQGYEATSLREIAERLGVTKAALYYHFKSKDEIAASFLADRAAAMVQVVEWGKQQPRTPQTRREVLTRYAEELRVSSHHKIMRFLERNQTALRNNPKSELMREIMISMVDLLCEPDEPFTIRLKCSLALFAMHAAWFVARDPDCTDEERSNAALTVAMELIESADSARSAATR